MKNIIAKTLSSLFIFLFILFSLPQVSYAGIYPGPERCTPGGFWGFVGGNWETGIDTAIGCIPLEIGLAGSGRGAEVFTGFMLRWAIGLGGGIAFVLIVYAGFMVTTSAGNPQRLQAGKELLTAAISGLLMLIFSVFLLRVIGIDILGLDNLGL